MPFQTRAVAGGAPSSRWSEESQRSGWSTPQTWQQRREPTTFFDPCEVLFTQGSIKNSFRNGLSLEDTACQLVNKDISKRDIEMIRVVFHDDGNTYTLDNRRLAVFRLLRFVGCCKGIKAKVVPFPGEEWDRKFDPHSDHSRIFVRGVKFIIADTTERTTYPLDGIRSAWLGRRHLETQPSVASLTRVQAILDGMDSEDEDDSDEEVLGRRPANSRQTRAWPVRRKNAADQRRGRKSGGRLEFADDLEPFAAGRSRYAYRCRARDGCVQGFSEGSYLVLKAFKPAFRQHEISPDESAEMQQEASRLAELFNTTARPTQDGQPCAVHVRDAAVVRLTHACRNQSGAVVIRAGENYLLEREIFGDFRKFNSNNGWASKTGSAIPSAFSHWTWARHGKLVCDLQGYQGRPPGPKYLSSKYYYLFTDPAIMSPDGSYGGGTDLGMRGIENWFSCHVCNDICRALGIDRQRPVGRRTLPVESSSSLQETSNSYGPRKTVVAACAVNALVAIAESEGDYDSDYD